MNRVADVSLTILIIVVFLLQCYGIFAWRHGLPYDLIAFYSAGQVILSHGDPYLTQPLFELQKHLHPLGENNGIVIPAPFPGYELAFFSLLARFSPQQCELIIGFLLMVSTYVVAFIGAKCSGLSLRITSLITMLAVLAPAIPVGQIAPLAIAGIAILALGVRESNKALMFLGALLAMLQPQFAAPAIFSAFLFVPQARIIMLITAFFLAFLSWITVGIKGNLEYLHSLPLQAKAEIGWPYEHSLSWLLHYLGVSADISLSIGAISTITAILIAYYFIYKHRPMAISSGLVVTLPSVAAIVGGTYLHAHQIPVILIAGFILVGLSEMNNDRKRLVGLALLLPCMVWFGGALHTHDSHIKLLIVFSYLVTLAAMIGSSLSIQARFTSKSARAQPLLYILCIVLYSVFTSYSMVEIPMRFLNTTHNLQALASSEWLQYLPLLEGEWSHSIYYLLIKLPGWIATVSIFVVSLQIMTLNRQETNSHSA